MQTGLAGLVIIEPRVHGDQRGFFKEFWKQSSFRQAGIPENFVQSNVSRSGAGVVRGLHYQYPGPQGKLITVLEGKVFDVAVDIRIDSPTYRQWAGVELSASNHRQLYIPEGFAHGFCVLGESALMNYLCTVEFDAEKDAAIAWNDPDIAVDWPVDGLGQPESLSSRDAAAPRLRDIAPEDLPRMPE
jgi:dTDP-4-dehydrorhamnose 3,5-epimerase